jgi:hypothetical protein
VTTTNTPGSAHVTTLESNRGHDGVIGIPQTLSSALSAASGSLRIRRVAVSVDAGRAQEFKRLVEQHMPRVVVTEEGDNTAAARQLIQKLDELYNKPSLSQQRGGGIGQAAGAANVDAAFVQALKDFNMQIEKPHAEME